MEKLGKKEFRRGIRWLAWSGILAIASVGGWVAWAQWMNRPPEAVLVRVTTAQKDTVEDAINASGTVELADQQTLKSPADNAAVEEVLVKVGDRVRAGQELLILRNPERQTILTKNELDTREAEIKLANQRQQIAAAEEKVKAAERTLQDLRAKRSTEKQNKLEDLQVRIQKQEISLKNNRHKIGEAEQELLSAERELKDNQTLFDKGFISENDLQEKKDAVRRARSQLRDAELLVSQAILDLQQIQLERQRIEQEFQDKALADETALRAAEAAVRDAQAARKQAETEVRTATIALERLQLDRKESEQKLQNNIVSAPIDGKILDVKVKAGNGVKVSDDLIVLGNPDREFVKLQLSTLDAARVQPNQEARISIIGPDAKPFAGRVIGLSPLAIAGNGSDGNSNQGPASVSATVQLNTPTGMLIPGSQVSVEIIVQQRQNAVVLNPEAIQRDDKTPYVWVRDALGNAQKKPVTTGLEGMMGVEVTAGLRSGDEVLLPPPEPPLEPGMPVKIEETAKKIKNGKEPGKE